MLNDTLRTVHATREVLLAAGTLGSPQVLMRSGVGPRHHLQRLEVRRDATSNDHNRVFVITGYVCDYDTDLNYS